MPITIGKYFSYTRSGERKNNVDIISVVKEFEKRWVGELFINSIDRDGTFIGYDTDLINMIAESLTIPVVACGGAGNINHLKDAIINGKASAVAAGSMFVFNGKHKAVLISYPSQQELITNLYSQI